MWESNIAMENARFIDEFPVQNSIHVIYREYIHVIFIRTNVYLLYIYTWIQSGDDQHYPNFSGRRDHHESAHRPGGYPYWPSSSFREYELDCDPVYTQLYICIYIHIQWIG